MNAVTIFRANGRPLAVWVRADNVIACTGEHYAFARELAAPKLGTRIVTEEVFRALVAQEGSDHGNRDSGR